MGTVRVYDLATAFRLTTKEVLERLSGAGMEATTFGSAVDEVRAREVLSQPVARIPAHMIRPGSGTTPAKPAPKRAARPRTNVATGEEPAAEKPAPRRRTAPKPKVVAEGEEPPAPKPRAPRKRAATAEVKPLLITLEAPTVELTVAPATVELPPPLEVAPPPAPTPPPPPVEAAKAVAPPPHLTGTMVASAIILSAVTPDPLQAATKYRAYLAKGIEIAKGPAR